MPLWREVEGQCQLRVGKLARLWAEKEVTGYLIIKKDAPVIQVGDVVSVFDELWGGSFFSDALKLGLTDGWEPSDVSASASSANAEAEVQGNSAEACVARREAAMTHASSKADEV